MTTAQIATSWHVYNDDESYKDVDAYIVMPDGTEWKFHIYLDKETRAIIHDEPMFSAHVHESFDDTCEEPPQEAKDALAQLMDAINAELLNTPSKPSPALIAAAPDLLAALRDALPYVASYSPEHTQAAKIRALIAKATGGAA
jgi:hypothetical protein